MKKTKKNLRKILIWIGLMGIFFYFITSTSSTTASSEKITEKITYQITYELEGGDNSILNPTCLLEDSMLPIELWSPKKDGYNFSGWYLDKKCTKEIRYLTELQEYTLYSKWTRNINNVANVENYPYELYGKNKKKALKELNYSFWYEINIPGNPVTKLKDYKNHIIDSTDQCPQGLCMTDNYVIVTSYSVEEEKALGTMAFYDKATGNHVKTFGMEEESHLGGVTFDGKNIWVCHSGTKEIERIDYAFIEKLIASTTQNFIDISRCFSRYEIRNIPSCVYYDNEKLYVATHKTLTSSVVKEYQYDAKENTLTYCKSYRIPSKVQGIAIDEVGQVYVSTSYGRRRSSHMMVYESLDKMNQALKKPMMTIELPPGSEEIYLDEDMIYLLFETACSKYYEGADGNGSCPYPIDKILMITKDSIFYD